MKRRIFVTTLTGLLLGSGKTALAQDDAPPKQHPIVAKANWDQVKEIVLQLGDHSYSPNDITLKVMQPYKLTLKNIGSTSHDMAGGNFFDEDVIALRMINSRVGRVTADHINSIYLRPKNDTELWFVPLKAGEFSFICSIAGHREAGMEGTIRVVD